MPKHLVSQEHAQEYAAFQRLTEGLDIAKDGALGLEKLRNDQRYAQIAALLETMKQQVYDLAGSGALVSGRH